MNNSPEQTRDENARTPTTARWSWIAVAALATIGLLGGGVWLGMQPGGVLTSLLSSQPQDRPAPLPPALERKARLFIRPGDAAGEFTDFTPPLRNGDRVRFEANVPRGYELALFLWSPTRGLELLAERGEDDVEPLRYPAELGKLAPIEGSKGTEFLFVCGSKNGPVREDEVANLLAAPQPWPALPQRSLLRVLGATTERSGSGAADGTDAEAVILRHLDQIGARMQGRYDYFEGLAFYHAD